MNAAQLTVLVMQLQEQVTALTARLDKAGTVVRDMAHTIALKQQPARVEAAVTPADRKEFGIAVAQLRAERGLRDGAFVKFTEVMERVQANTTHHAG